MAPKLDSMLLASADPERLQAWYEAALAPSESSNQEGYLVLRFGDFWILVDRRDDVGAVNPEPGRMILNFDVEDARAAAARLDEVGTTWLAPLEDRDGSLFATAIDPDGNYVQIMQMSEAEKARMAELSAAPST